MNIPDTGREAMEAMQNGEAVGNSIPEPEVLSALGAVDLIGSLTAQNSLGRIMLLQQIDSPFLLEDSDDVDIIDIARALFIMAHGAEAMRPIYSVQRRLKSISQREPKGNESLYRLWLDKLDSIAEDECAFDIAAMGFLEDNFSADSDFAMVQELLVQLIEEQLKPLASMPDTPGNDGDQKKK